MKFFLDESGNTGGITQKSYASSFDGQRIFSLAAFGIAEEAALADKLKPLIDRYKIKAAELKASTFYKKRPVFLRELFTLIKQEAWPVFIEVVDKKFMLSANIVNSLILPPHAFDTETSKSNFVRNVFAEYIFLHNSDYLNNRFLTICGEPSRAALIGLIDEFITHFTVHNDDIASTLIHSLSMTKDDLQGADMEDKDIVNILPGSDLNKGGKTLFMLPHLSSFTNIYARINLFLRGDLSNVYIFHDEQLQFDQIIEKAKRDVEQFPCDDFGYISTNSDYHFKESATLFFKASHDSLGVQVADTIAGFSRRYFDDVQNKRPINPELVEAQRILMTMNNQKIGTGLNMMTSLQDSNKINQPHFE